MENLSDLRKILSQNIKTVRNELHISQEKLAEYADISLSYMTDIERCRTWVSDKTLQSLAKALNMEAWELLSPAGTENRIQAEREQSPNRRERNRDRQIAGLIAKKKEAMRHVVDKSMEELVLEIIQEK